MKVMPVTLPLNRLSFETRPAWTGSNDPTKTIGMVPVADLAANAAGGASAAIKLTRRLGQGLLRVLAVDRQVHLPAAD